MPVSFSSQKAEKRLSFLLFLLSFFLFAVTYRFSVAIADGIKSGLLIFVSSVFPRLFPLMILSDLFAAYARDVYFSPFSRLFSKIFHLPPAAFIPVFFGLLFGFPLGIVSALSRYQTGVLTKDECERIFLLSSVPSPAFLIGCAGGAFGDLYFGIYLYVLAVLTSLLTGFLFGIHQPYDTTIPAVPSPSFSLVGSVRTALEKSLCVCGFIALFSGICRLFALLPSPFSYLAVSLFEITSSVSLTGSLGLSRFCACLLSFSACFTGFSFLFQGYSLFIPYGMSFSRFLFGKALNGVFGVILTLLLFPVLF